MRNNRRAFSGLIRFVYCYSFAFFLILAGIVFLLHNNNSNNNSNNNLHIVNEEDEEHFTYASIAANSTTQPTFNEGSDDFSPILNPNCDQNGDEDEKQSQIIRQLLSENHIQRRLSDCDEYFATIPVEALRRSFDPDPDLAGVKFAFSHQVHKSVGILEIFLALMFRPRNFHCVHVDLKAPLRVHEAVAALASCYNRRFGAGKIEVIRNPRPVFWGHISVLAADLACLRLSLERSPDWTYFVNTAGTELPVAGYPNFEAVAAKAEGGNVLESYKLPKFFESRVNRYYQMERYFNPTRKHFFQGRNKWDQVVFQLLH